MNNTIIRVIPCAYLVGAIVFILLGIHNRDAYDVAMAVFCLVGYGQVSDLIEDDDVKV